MNFLAQKDNCLCDKIENKRFIHVNPRTNMQIHTPTVVQGGGWKSPLVFLICCSISKRFYLQRKAFNGGTAGGGRAVTSSTMVVILGAILDFTKNWKSG